MPKRSLLELFTDGEDVDLHELRNELKQFKTVRVTTWNTLVKPIRTVRPPPPSTVDHPQMPTDFPMPSINDKKLELSYNAGKHMLNHIDRTVRYSPDAHSSVSYYASLIYMNLFPSVQDFYAKISPELASHCQRAGYRNGPNAKILATCGAERGRIVSYLIYEILDNAVTECINRNRKVVTERMIDTGIEHDKDLLEMFKWFARQ